MNAQPARPAGGGAGVLDALLRRGPRSSGGAATGTVASWHELVVAAAQEGILAIEPDGRVAFANPAAVELLAGVGAELVGLPFEELVAESDGCPVRAALDGGQVVRADLKLQPKGGEPFPAELTAAPVREGERIVGVVVLFRDATELKRLGEYELQLFAAEEREAFQRLVVEQLQAAVRPPRPDVPETDLAVHYLPADPAQATGGDLYDWQVLPDGDLHLCVVDVLGKGVQATKHALAVVHALRILALDGCPVERMVGRTHELLAAHNPELVATLLVGRYTPSTGRLLLAGASHPPALVVRSGGEVEELAAPGIAVGWPHAGSEVLVERHLGRFDTLILYTDGLIEATRNIARGIEELKQAAAETARYPARHLPRVLVERSLAGSERRDDTLALVLRRRVPPQEASSAAPVGAFEYRFSPRPVSIPLVRAFFSLWMASQPLERSQVDDLLLVASELATNALRASSGAEGSCCLRAWVEGADVVVEAEDDGAGLSGELPPADELPALEGERGRGLFIVRGLVDDVVVERRHGVTLVRAIVRGVLPLADAGGIA